MDWIFDNFQIVILVVLALASWFKTRMDAKTAEREEREAREEMGEGEVFGPPEDWEQDDTPAPPSLPPPPTLQTARPALAAAEAAREAEMVLKRQSEMQERLRQIRESKAVTTGGAAAARSRAAAKNTPRQADSKTPSYKSLVSNRRSLRNAIVTREILGKPLGLR